MTYHVALSRTQDTMRLGEQIGGMLKGGERLVLVGDLGAGKTTLVKGIARGMGIVHTVQSPSYALSLTYNSPSTGLELHHYDLYRLNDLALIQYEIDESCKEPFVVVVIEWAERLPENALGEVSVVTLSHTSNDRGREVTVTGPLAISLSNRESDGH